MFAPFRAIGLVSDGTPFALQQKGTVNFVTTSYGRNFYVYNTNGLQLVSSGGPTDRKIRFLVSDDDDTYLGVGSEVFCWRRGKLLFKFDEDGHNTGSTLKTAIRVGHLILAVNRERQILIYDIQSRKLSDIIDTGIESQVSCILHPPTYLDKILIGFEDGSIQLWNVRSKKLIHLFNKMESGITCGTTSTALDIVAFGLRDGSCVVLNIRYDEVLVVLKNDQVENTTITSCCFRYDDSSQFVCGTSHGELIVWDLKDGVLLCIEKDAHVDQISVIKFLNKEPILVTSGLDNSLKMWIFDQSEGEPRLLRARNGHAYGSSLIQVYENDDGHNLLSAGEDGSFRLFSTILERQNREFAQKKFLKKRGKRGRLGRILMFDSNYLREQRFDNIVTCHEKDDNVYLWSYYRKALDRQRVIRIRNGKGGLAKEYVSAVCISACGNHCFTGTSEGWMEMWNMQSGIWRGTVPGSGGTPHSALVSGINSDSVNEFVYSSSLDGKLCIYKFKDRSLHKTVETGSPINSMKLCRGKDLILLALDDFSIRILDPRDLNSIRKFEISGQPLLDFAISSDMKTLAVSSMDSTLRIFSVMNSALVSEIDLESPIQSLAFDKTGSQLMATYVDRRGIYVLINKAFYSSSYLLLGTEEELDTESQSNEISSQPIKNGLLSTSEVSANHIQRLAYYSTIKERNKATVEAPVEFKAPFFLPTKPGLSMQFDIDKDEVEALSRKRKIARADFQQKTQLSLHLLQDSEYTEEEGAKGFPATLEYLKSGSAASTEFEIASLLTSDEDDKDLELFLRYCLFVLEDGSNLDLIQAHLKLFLEFHYETLIGNAALRPVLRKTVEAQNRAMERLNSLFDFNICAIDHMCRIRM